MQKFKFKNCIEIYIINECNLTCSNCNRYNNYNFQGYYNWNDNVDAINAWAKRITAPMITLIGGEPALHPHLLDWVQGITQAWPGIPVMVQTNGTVINKDQDSIQAIQNAGFGVAVHDRRMNNKLIKVWDNRGGIFDATEFSDCALIDRGHDFVVHNSNPVQAFNACGMRHSHTLLQGRLYKCPMVAVLPEFRKQYQVTLDESQERLLNSYQSLGSDCSNEELEQFIKNQDEPIPQCNLCPSENNTSLVNFDLSRKRRSKKQ